MGGGVFKAVVAAALMLAAAAIASGCGSSGSGGTPTVKWYVFKEPGGSFDAAAAACTKQAHGRYKVEVVALPTDSDQQRELVVRRLAAKDKDIDVIGMDVNWTAEFADAGWIVPWTGRLQQVASSGVIPALLAAAQYKGKVWVAPLTSNTQLLWYHKDVAKTPPATWDQMIAQAKRIGGKRGKIVVQGRRYEGLVVWFNTLVASAGGQIVNRQGQTVLGAPAVRAAQIMRDTAKQAGTASISNEKEDTGLNDFTANDLAFMVNYPFVYAGIQKMGPAAVKNLGWARYPSVNPGQPSHVTIGGINLGVSKYSKHKALSFEAATCLLQPPQEISYTEKGGLPPVKAALYDDPRIKKAYPFADILKATLADGVARPVTPAYSDISLAVQDSLHPPDGIDPPAAIKNLADDLKKAKQGKLF
jgi:multiple sugar transport system substrate-binding protein